MRSYPPTPPHTVTAAELAAFADALGYAPGSVAPTFAMALARPAWEQFFGDPELGYALERTIHADQSFELARPFAAGDIVTATLRVMKVRQRSETDWVSVAVDLDALTDGVPERVATATSTFICTRGRGEQA